MNKSTTIPNKRFTRTQITQTIKYCFSCLR
nr:MAG TPA: hypothetical protein [Caudoviricetes sp.]